MADYKLVDHIVGDVATLSTNTQTIEEGIYTIGAPNYWKEGIDGDGVVVATIDTGVYKDHPDLKDNIIGGRNFTTDYDSDPENYNDGNFHGTHVAGIIAAGNNSVGIVGVAPKAKILALKALSNDGTGAWAWLIKAINYAVEWRGPNGEKVRVINMSLGGPFAPTTLHDAIINAVNSGIVVVCAAGNEGDSSADTTEISYPGYYPEVICVGSFNGWGGVSDFSNSNDQVDLIAPGSNILSTSNDGGYITASGTSMATPHAVGAIALLIQKLDKLNDREVTEKELYNFLVNNCTSNIGNLPKMLQGNGLIHLSETIEVSIDDVDFNDVLHWFTSDHPRPVLNSYDYWEANAQPGKTVVGEYAQGFMKKTYIVHGLNAKVKD